MTDRNAIREEVRSAADWLHHAAEARTQPVDAFDVGGSVGQDARRAREVDVVGS
jgi:hypothetical protein